MKEEEKKNKNDEKPDKKYSNPEKLNNDDLNKEEAFTEFPQMDQEKEPEEVQKEKNLQEADKISLDTNPEKRAYKEKDNTEKMNASADLSPKKESKIQAEKIKVKETLSKEEAAKDKKGSGIVINIEHVKKTFGTNTVLNDINLKVRKGETLVTLGRSGTGKSVILQCIVGLLTPDEGSIRVFSQEIPKLSKKELLEIRKKIGFLFQSGALYDSMTVKENLIFPMKRLYDYNDAEMETRVKEALNNVGLLKAIDKMPSELSGGMRKRIALARTLVLDPEIILYDEPTTGLDPATSREISELILMTQEKFNVASIIVTHDMECAQMTADRVVVLKDGKYIIDGTFDEAEKSDDPFVKSFFEFLPAAK